MLTCLGQLFEVKICTAKGMMRMAQQSLSIGSGVLLDTPLSKFQRVLSNEWNIADPW